MLKLEGFDIAEIKKKNKDFKEKTTKGKIDSLIKKIGNINYDFVCGKLNENR